MKEDFALFCHLKRQNSPVKTRLRQEMLELALVENIREELNEIEKAIAQKLFLNATILMMSFQSNWVRAERNNYKYSACLIFPMRFSRC